MGFRIFSQNDEDGILLYIFSQVGFTNRVCIDIGFASIQGSNTANLILNWGFSGVLIDGNKEGIAQSQHYFNYHPDTKIFPPTVINKWVTVENINDICMQNGISDELDIMSLDIDGNDYWIWKALTVVKPRVVVVEYNCLWGPDKSVTIPYKPDFVAHQNPEPLISIHSVDSCFDIPFVKWSMENRYKNIKDLDWEEV